ncbi:ArsR/SmtB family transcription factor [Microlunatus soli]|uniref:Rhodanese-related sulfurtransferase n=1 Tax=Microlunatus soli TaxID=630515 RepID=A0A1H2A5E0_9ACTN|nr:metalloregulator ArsR/SmtB family transcription factor [Microlunatus soli]SDT41134.1 Rhodanese-related sulfurtransferase [Microlunatus soli]
MTSSRTSDRTSSDDQQPSAADGETGYVDDAVYEQLSRLGKALSNPGRIRILDLLEQGEHTVEEIADAARIPMKNTSAQLQQLRAAQLVSTRRDGVRIYYRLASPAVSTFVDQFETFAEQTLADLQVELGRMRELPGGMERLSVEEFRTRIASGDTIVVDVRPAEEYARGHLPGAISMPLEDLRSHIDELPEDADVVAYCEGPYCFASARAVRRLLAAGRDAHRIDGGLARWVRSGGELSR